MVLWHMEFQDDWDRTEQKNKVRKDTKTPIGEEEGVRIDTSTFARGIGILRPEIRVWPALDPSDDHNCHPPAQNEEGREMKQFSEPCRGKNAVVEE